MAEENKELKKTTDIWFAAYLQFKGYELSDFEVLHPGKSVFLFTVSPEAWKDLKLEFNNHEISKIRRLTDGLKDLSY